MTIDKNALEVFVLVAQTRNFRIAAERLGVTRSAISQTLRRLEERMSVSLMLRTTRSIHLTEAGKQLYAEIAPAMEQLNNALADTIDRIGEPRGQLRLAVSSIAERIIDGKLLVNCWRILSPLTHISNWILPLPMMNLILWRKATMQASGSEKSSHKI